VSRQAPGHQWAAAGPDEVTGNPEKYVFNNIFYMFDERVIFRDDLVSLGSHYDGNVVYRNNAASLPLFSNFGDGGRYDSLLEFQTNSGANWERHGLELEPGFDLAALNDPGFDPAGIWERYRPSNKKMFTPGAAYCGLDWPETQGVYYRGAVPPLPLSVPDDVLEIFEIFLPLVYKFQDCP
jgi:hypothetical protein